MKDLRVFLLFDLLIFFVAGSSSQRSGRSGDTVSTRSESKPLETRQRTEEGTEAQLISYLLPARWLE